MRTLKFENCRKFSHPNLGTLSANVFNYFHSVLAETLASVPKLESLNLKSPNSRTSLPSTNSLHLSLLSQHCPQLKYLDISFIIGLKNEDLLLLITGCPKLEYLYIYDCGFSDKCVKSVVLHMNHLKEVGYKEMGSVIKKLAKETEPPQLKFKHINHLGGRLRKTSVSSLRCKRSLTEAIAKICPETQNLKVRVQDVDVGELVLLEKLTSIGQVSHQLSLNTGY